MRYPAAMMAVLLGLAGPAFAAVTTQYDTQLTAAKTAMMGEPAKALTHARAAASATATMPEGRDRSLAFATSQWLEAEALARINQPEKARATLDTAMATVVRLAPNSKLRGDLFLARAQLNWMTGQVSVALGEAQAAFAAYEKVGEARGQAKALQFIGTFYFDARDYPQMLKYYRQSAEIFGGDPTLSLVAYNNQGDALKEMARYDEALVAYRKSLRVVREMQSPVLEARVLTNMASAQYLAGKLDDADALTQRGLRLVAGQDSGWEPFLYGVRAQIAVKRGDWATAEAALGRTFAGQPLDKTTIQFREFHDTARQVFARKNDTATALVHLTALKRLDDEARDIAASTNAALMTARFDFANQELKLTKLRERQLQSNVALERSRAQFNQFALYAVLTALAIAAVVLAGTLWGMFKLARSRNEVTAANDNLSVANAELEQALTAKSRFLATTSHEIRTPLNGILGMAQVMLTDTTLVGAQRDRVRIVYDAGETMRALVDDILDVAKIEKGGITIEPAPFALRPLLESVVRLWRDEAEAKGLAVTTCFDAAPTRVLGDERRIRQIVFNLMSNAVKFTEKGTIELRVACHDNGIEIAVADTGIGIAAEDHQSAFVAFHQIDGGTTRQYGGTGLGLSISRDLARAMAGDVTVESEPGVGSTFTVHLPLPIVDAVDDVRQAATTAAQAVVLLVEDNPLKRSMIAAALAPAVARVAGTASIDLSAALADARPDHVVIDAAALASCAETLTASMAAGVAVLVVADADATLPDWLDTHNATVLRRPVGPPDLIAAIEARYGVPAAMAA